MFGISGNAQRLPTENTYYRDYEADREKRNLFSQQRSLQPLVVNSLRSRCTLRAVSVAADPTESRGLPEARLSTKTKQPPRS
jgi:hypothetical protein